MREKKARGRHPHLWAAIYGVSLAGYAVFTLLDAFVLPRDLVYFEDIADGADTGEMEADGTDPGKEEAADTESAGAGEAADPVITSTSYESEGISISITTKREYDTEIYIADVVLEDISHLRAGLAGGAFGRNIKETTSAMAEDNNAILAVNGDYYGFRDTGFVMRNGYLYRDTARQEGDDDALVICGDGHMEVISENDAQIQGLLQDAVQIFSFGPGLIRDGEILVTQSSEVGKAMQSNPRTAVGEIEPLHYVLLVSDGRTEESEGLSLWELAEFMKGLGCDTAYNLDGGGSSVMWFMGSVVNHPTDGWKSGERSVSDIVYIGE